MYGMYPCLRLHWKTAHLNPRVRKILNEKNTNMNSLELRKLNTNCNKMLAHPSTHSLTDWPIHLLIRSLLN
jgi:hypothetical protein